jgi:hypothetical protein
LIWLIIVQKTDQTEITDFTNATQWQAADTANTAVIITGVKGEFPTPEVATIENPVAGGVDEIPAENQYTFNLTDPNVNGTNDAFWAALNGQVKHFVWYNSKTEEIRVVELEVTITAPPASNPVGSGEFQAYNVVLNWTSEVDEYPIRYDATALSSIFVPS